MIQINTDKNLSVNEAYQSKIRTLIEKELKRFDEQITRVEVHLNDENNSKAGLHDKKCLLEARLKGLDPIVVSDLSSTYDFSIDGAINKLKTTLDTRLGKLQSH